MPMALLSSESKADACDGSVRHKDREKERGE